MKSTTAADCRRDARDNAKKTSNESFQKILSALRDSPKGLTRGQLSAVTGIKLQTICARVVDLKNAKQVQETNERRTVGSDRASSVLVICEPPAPPKTLFDDQDDSFSGHYSQGY
jgi:hypothetical protein